jgi:ankyrin repeat protein
MGTAPCGQPPSEPPLVAAVLNYDRAAVKQLLGSGVDPNMRSASGDTALMRTSDADIATQLLNAGADVYAEDGRGKTALHYALWVGNERMILLLLNAGARVDAPDRDGATPLLVSAGRRHATLCRLLLDHGADVKLRDREGNPVLVWTVLRLDGLFDPRRRDFDSLNRLRPPLIGCLGGCEIDLRVLTDTLGLLLDRGAEPDARGSGGMTALHWAAHQSDDASTKLLLDHGASVDVLDARGRTALMWAAERGDTDVAGLLLAARANMRLEDPNGETALSLARKQGHPAVVKMLRRAGVTQQSR